MTRLPRHPVLASLLALALGIAGCIEVPELDRIGDPDIADADYPDLIPLGPVVATTRDPTEDAQDLQADLQGRTAQLQRRADALRGSEVLDPAARRRLQSGLDR